MKIFSILANFLRRIGDIIANVALFAILVLIAIVFLMIIGAGVFIVLIMLPFFLGSSLGDSYAFYRYEMEHNILSILRTARYSNEVKFGWMTRNAILKKIENIFDDGRRHRFQFNNSLNKLVSEDVVAVSKVPVEYVEKNPIKTGLITAYKLDEDSDYKPKRPARLPKEKRDIQHGQWHAV